MTADTRSQAEHYSQIADAIRFIKANAHRQPNLTEIAAHLGLSEFHFQRLFVEWAGISPKEFLQAITLERAKAALGQSGSLLDATYEAGLSSSSRLHDLFVTVEAMSPGEFRRQGQHVEIRWSVDQTPFGSAVFAETDRGICRISFVSDDSEALADLRERWPQATFKKDSRALRPTVDEMTRRMSGAPPRATLGVVLTGPPLRLKVWQALLQVPRAALISYQTVAQMAGHPSAVRAVASSIGENPLGFLIPCHRVIRQNGAFGEYHWGEPRKLAMIGRELAGATSNQ
jgi:AraC family transcriptional regulator of adaptative response/methylated-DNA-[protein]-cysteine methyltransferase